MPALFSPCLRRPICLAPVLLLSLGLLWPPLASAAPRPASKQAAKQTPKHAQPAHHAKGGKSGKSKHHAAAAPTGDLYASRADALQWADEAAALAWRKVAEHAEIQSKGRAEYYESYTLFAGTPTRVHHFNRDET